MGGSASWTVAQGRAVRGQDCGQSVISPRSYSRRALQKPTCLLSEVRISHDDYE